MTFDFDALSAPIMMGILNLTPDSFSDGGNFCSLNTACAHARELLASGAQILDLGGESTRPGSNCVPVDEELRRLTPVVRELRMQFPNAILSIDTRKSAVARTMLGEGVSIINDVSGGCFDPAILETVAQTNAYYVLMHARATPDNMQNYCKYTDMFVEISDYFSERIVLAERAGILKDKIILDPGLGFAKTAQQSMDIVQRYTYFLERFPEHYHLIGHSRKSFLTLLTGDVPPIERDAVTHQITQQLALLSSKLIFRVHRIFC